MSNDKREYNQGFVEGNNDAMYGAEKRFYDFCGVDLFPVIIETFPHRGAVPLRLQDFQFACGYIDGYQAAEG